MCGDGPTVSYHVCIWFVVVVLLVHTNHNTFFFFLNDIVALVVCVCVFIDTIEWKF